ncbi:MAG: phosphatase PAP2 family protein, partial [Sulfuricellaceae bacterium]|nr:phosphatase PAP2 family protein [Sulfuricellaceae bacterium]
FKALAALFVLWVGISRISLGFHFPADVLGGFISCLLIVSMTRFGVRWLQRLV